MGVEKRIYTAHILRGPVEKTTKPAKTPKTTKPRLSYWLGKAPKTTKPKT